ncbi:zinc finger CCHC domain-containing protein 9 isoform X1 [Vidua macroura]|uniref:zinc finger CCHC domain-containing protein 9 isoform X1 n=1 Tax=Vidua macroura TaxID=187451 RepID=UPI0023A8C4B4|nr:zinc finger CCHC domain-containing protein 9 isoform X1 [Vidua macroura]
MTRWARRSAPPGARALPATPWEQLAPSGPEPPRAARSGRRKKKKEYENQDVNGFAAHRGEEEEEEEARRKDRRRESRRLRRQERKKNAMVCFHCREPGHGVADCPAVLESQDMGTGICYRCGSTEHDLSKCRAKVDPAAGPFPYAKCFICGEMGHLSRSCPDNPKGLYAEGGGCKLCGSVEHFKKDCPEKQNAGDSGALDPRPERGPRGRRGRAGAAESAAQATQGRHFLKAPGSQTLLLRPSADDRERIQKIKQAAEELLVFRLPSFSRFASQTCLAHCEAGNKGSTASGCFIKGIAGVF